MTWPYFGSKIGSCHLYPKPLHDLIIEPFCGAAAYACKYGLSRDVWINDKFTMITDIWKYIRGATRKDIMALPKLYIKGQSLDDHKYLSEVERNLLGFAVSCGSVKPQPRVTLFSMSRKATLGLRSRLLRYVDGAISHWKITNLDYFELPNKQATWFIDPPYQHQGSPYVHNEINYKRLAKWCKERLGQSIVCEGPGADWLPFIPINSKMRRQKEYSKYTEVMYYQSDRKGGFGLRS